MMNPAELDKIFTYHRPKTGQPETYEAIRETARSLAILINRSCPDSREKSVAITKVQEAVMWANASIAIHQSE
jgi:hypothetical protein